MHRKLSREYGLFLLQKLWKTSKNSQYVIEGFTDKFPAVLPPNTQVILNHNKRFEQTENVADLTS
jgi:hypothetical protein